MSSVSPTEGLEAGGTPVTLKGSELSGSVTVLFNGSMASDVVVVDSSTLTCKTPATTPPPGGYVNVVVSTSGGSATLTSGYRYLLELVEESFSGGPALPAGLVDPSGAYQVSGGRCLRTGNGSRAYVETTGRDYLLKDFTYEVTFTNQSAGVGLLFIGLGDPQGFQEPWNGLNLRLHAVSVASAKASVMYRPPLAVGGVTGHTFETPVLGNLSSGGVHRARVTKAGNTVTLAVDADYAGGAFTADFSHVVSNVEVLAPFLTSTNTRLFFGTGKSALWFDDLRIAVARSSTPRVRRVVAAAGPPAGMTSVTVSGAGFQTGTATVTIGGVAATGVAVASDTSLTCVTPAGSGASDVAVTTADGTGTSVGAYVYRGPFFAEDFDTVVFNHNLEDPTAVFQLRDSVLLNPTTNRRFVRTRLADYTTRDFVYDVILRPSSNLMFVGIGTETVGPPVGEPQDAVFLLLRSGGNAEVVVAPAGAAQTVTTLGALGSSGPHTARLAKTGNQLVLSIDLGRASASAPFVADLTFTITDLATTAPFLTSTTSRLFFGCQRSSDRFYAMEIRAP